MKAYKEPDDTLEASDIKRILKCGINQVYELIQSGQFHYVKVGKKYKVPSRSFYKWYYGEEQKEAE